MQNQYNDNEEDFPKNKLNKKRFKKYTGKDNEEKFNEQIETQAESQLKKFKKIDKAFKDIVIKINIRSKSVDQLISKLNQLSLNEKILKNYHEQKRNNEHKTKNKKTYIIKGENITDLVEIIDNSKFKNIPYKIKYNEYIFYIRGADPTNNLRVTWRCINYRKLLNLPDNENIFCHANIQGIRENTNSNIFKFFLKNNHSDVCIKLKNEVKPVVNLSKKKLKTKNVKLESNTITRKDFNNLLEEYLKNNKNLKITCKDFILYAKKIYFENKLNDKFKIDDIYLKNVYYKIKKNMLHINLEDVYEYSKFNNDKNFCRSIVIKQLVTKEKKTIDHKAILFFTDFDIKRLIISEHILLDGTFIFPEGFMQTIIIMYYDILIEKMIPGIFIVINNKTFEGYIDCFTYIKNYITKLNNNNQNSNMKTFTSDFEVGLYKAFNIVFNRDNKIRHIGCYFHFLQNIRKFLQKNNLTTLKNKTIYNIVINFCKSLPFLNLNEINIKKRMENLFKNYINELSGFISYFNENWLKYFIDGTLNLNDINVKFRTNNCLENFNRILKRYFNMKKNIPMITFIDVLKEEVSIHEEFMINENKKALKPLSKTKLKGEFNYNYYYKDLDFYEDISKEILSFDVKENFISLPKVISLKEEKATDYTIIENKITPENINNLPIKNTGIYEEINDKYLNIDFTRGIEIYDNKFIGFNNLGNTCYLNSGLQILFHLKNFIINLSNIKDFQNKQITRSLVLLIEQIKNIMNFSNLDFSMQAISPYEFKRCFEYKHSLFNNDDQQDCAEFLRFLLEDISQENNRIKKKFIYEELEFNNQSRQEVVENFHNFFIKKEDSFIVDNFYIQLLNIYKCNCGFETFSCEKILDIPLKMPNIKNYSIKELLDLNLYYDNVKWGKICQNCKKKDLIIEQYINFSILNEVVFISLQRFNRKTNSINNSLVKYDDVLDLNPYMDIKSESNDYMYFLKAIVHYRGNIEKGHYWSNIKIRGEWYEFNDNFVKKLDRQEYQNSTVFILVYEKIKINII